MIRGTTAKYTFKLPCRKDELLWATMEFSQPRNYNANLPIIKKLEHCDAPDDSNELCVSLTAEETSRFLDKYKARVQLRAEHIDGTVFGSRVKIFTVYPMSNGMIGEDPELPAQDESGWVVFDGEEIVKEETTDSNGETTSV